MNNEEKILYMLEGLTSTVETLVTKVDKLEQGQAKLEQGQAKLEQEVGEVKDRLILIEADHGQKLNAALDGYGMLYDISLAIRKDIADLKDSEFNQDVKILDHTVSIDSLKKTKNSRRKTGDE